MTDTNGRPQSCRRSRSNLKLKIILIIPPFQSVKKCTKELHVWFQWNLTGLRIIVHFPGKKNCHNPVVGALQIYFQKSFFIAQQTNQSQFFKIDDSLQQIQNENPSVWHAQKFFDTVIPRLIRSLTAPFWILTVPFVNTSVTGNAGPNFGTSSLRYILF